MDQDDQPVGHLLSRREFLALFGATGAALLASCLPGQTATPTGAPASNAAPAASSTAAETSAPVIATSSANVAGMPTCVVRPAMTEGPYFVDEKLDRSDIRSDPTDGAVKEGLPLQLTFAVSQIGDNTCIPLEGASVDVWHCDALGVYSDVSDPGFNTQGKKFLRGYQETDANGMAQFTTIYPGWYQGRTVHIHFKIRTGSETGQSYEFTSQLFFDDSLSDQVYTQEPYAGKGERTTRNEGDGIFQNGGDQLTLQLTPAEQGYATTFNIGLQMA